jgi:hypothetical protein
MSINRWGKYGLNIYGGVQNAYNFGKLFKEVGQGKDHFILHLAREFD